MKSPPPTRRRHPPHHHPRASVRSAKPHETSRAGERRVDLAVHARRHPQGRPRERPRHDLRFVPFLQQFLTAPQTFWGSPSTAATARSPHRARPPLRPRQGPADDNRYVSISGCVVHFCPARGLLWIDLNGAHHLVVFAAIDWSKQGRPTSDPAAEYTLWVFPDERSPSPPRTGHPPAARAH